MHSLPPALDLAVVGVVVRGGGGKGVLGEVGQVLLHGEGVLQAPAVPGCSPPTCQRRILPDGADVADVLGEAGRRIPGGDRVASDPAVDHVGDRRVLVGRRGQGCLHHLRVGNQGPGHVGGQQERLGAEVPGIDPLVPAWRGAGSGVEQEDQPRPIAGPESTLQVVAERLALVQGDVVLEHQVGVGIGALDEQFGQRQEPTRPGADGLLAPGGRQVGVAWRHTRGPVQEQPGRPPASPDDPVQARLQRRLPPRRGCHADRPVHDRSTGAAPGEWDEFRQRHGSGDRPAPGPIPADPAPRGGGDFVVGVLAMVERLGVGCVQVGVGLSLASQHLVAPGRRRAAAPGAGEVASGGRQAERRGQGNVEGGLGQRADPARRLAASPGSLLVLQNASGRGMQEAGDDRVDRPPGGWERPATRGAGLVRDRGRCRGGNAQ